MVKTPQNKPILDYVKNKLSCVYKPERKLSIDESLLLRKGDISFVQYKKIKRAWFGIKTYILSESKSGYIETLLIYGNNETEIVDNPDYGHATSVVLTIKN